MAECYETLHTCSECGKAFVGARRSLTCSTVCATHRQERLRKEKENTNMHTKQCAICGAIFRTGTDRITCSSHCASLLSGQRRRESEAARKKGSTAKPKTKKPRAVKPVPMIEIEKLAKKEKTSYGKIVAKYSEEELRRIIYGEE